MFVGCPEPKGTRGTCPAVVAGPACAQPVRSAPEGHWHPGGQRGEQVLNGSKVLENKRAWCRRKSPTQQAPWELWLHGLCSAHLQAFVLVVISPSSHQLTVPTTVNVSGSQKSNP